MKTQEFYQEYLNSTVKACPGCKHPETPKITITRKDNLPYTTYLLTVACEACVCESGELMDFIRHPEMTVERYIHMTVDEVRRAYLYLPHKTTRCLPRKTTQHL
jgi:hypothetical protein